MNDTQQRLTPELVSMAIENGMLDAALPALKQVVRDRLEILDRRAASALAKGDRFLIKDCSPKKWNGIEVTFERHDGQWLVCAVSDFDTSRLRLHGTEVRLRTVHVGTVTHKVGA